MTSIANLSVSLTAQTQGFTQAMSGVTKHIEGISSKISGITRGFLGFAAAMASVAVGGAIGEVLKKTAETVVQNARLAEQLGYTANELNAIHDAAQLANIGVETVDRGMNVLSKTLGEGSENTKEALDAIGLSFGKLATLRPAEKFKAIADGVAGLATQEEKAAVAARLFGRGGMDLLTLLQQGKAKLDATAAATMKLRGEFSRIDAAKVQMANDAVDKLHIIISGVLQKSVSLLAPYVAAIANHFLAMGANGKSAADIIVDGMTRAAKSFAVVFDAINIVIAGFHLINGVFAAIEEGFARATDRLAHSLIEWANLFGMNIDEGPIDESVDRIKGWEEEKRAEFEKTRKAWDAAMNHEMSGAIVRGASGIQRSAELLAADQAKEDAYWAGPQYQKQKIDYRTSVVGTFSGMAAGRLTAGAQTVEEQQVEELKGIKNILGNINDNIAGGVPVD